MSETVFWCFLFKGLMYLNGEFYILGYKIKKANKIMYNPAYDQMICLEPSVSSPQMGNAAVNKCGHQWNQNMKL